MTDIIELFTINTSIQGKAHWARILRKQYCSYLDRRCLKVRKSQPDISIGTCTVCYGREKKPVIICPHRLLEKNKIFTDCIHLLQLHEPGNEFHVVSEVTLPGGSVDYFLLSVKNGKVKDFVGIELQTLDTTGTVWPERQRYLQSQGLSVSPADVQSAKPFGMNWKMTAKTILVQLHHKVETLEKLGKHLVIVIQDEFLHYMKGEFSFDHIQGALLGNSMHFHSYAVTNGTTALHLDLAQRLSTDSAGIARCLGLQAESSMELADIISQLEGKISEKTLLSIFPGKTDEITTTT